MEPYQERVVAERADLHRKIDDLAKFMDSMTAWGLDDDKRRRLIVQLRHMNDYRDALDERIATF
jgi:hypothetical protein